ncbi:hypothetical protein SOVF_009850 [Spinacia oleracea]|uniref:Telomere repeat-binding protein 3 n=1 Tax=Spinacia oleracea TaxID=3562 RepID=A0A9R0IUY9_SPIOL|nr:telomere repeat-binding protein 3 [Spinacia oleracea]KNA25070.1 hypothetical protein SOVF_009850 [Spinacia oleracea]
MVLLKRTLDHGVNGYPSPAIPRAPRSIRKRGFRQKKREGGQVCAFELLATVAGKLLEESECSSASSSAAVGFDQCGIDKNAAIKKELLDVDKTLGGEHDDQGSSEGSVFFSGLQRDTCKGKLETVKEVTADHVSLFASSACSEKVDCESKLVTQKINDVFVKHSCKIDGSSPKCGESDDTNLDNGLIRKLLCTNGDASGDITTANKSSAPANCEENVNLTLCRGSNPNASSLKHGSDVKLNCKDDDEILSRCSKPNNTMKAFRSPTCVEDHKLLMSGCWKTVPKLKDDEPSNTDGGSKQNYPCKRPSYEIDRSQRNTPFKKRRLLERSSVVTYDGGISCESVSNSPEKEIDVEKNLSAGKLHEGKGMPSSVFCRQKSCNSRNSQVRLSIKSFKVPELFIEVSESTTVGSLKKTVLEAVTTILGSGLRVGVLLQGKKIRDDSRTLLQSGIAQSDDMDTVGFMLEPNSPSQPSPPIYPEEPPSPLPCDSPKFVNRSQVNPNGDSFAIKTPEKPSITYSNRSSGSIKDLVPSTTELTDKTVSNSKALVSVPEESMEALTVVPMSQRSKRPDIGQRRTRRPFSVSEVEALVRAVEKLGTGRWRDVKLCSFENAKHRTYVDLKDKWKTLVHTARISPQQRRGEPVPQDLLDRVLAAQSYWSEHQAKQHGKQQQQQGIFPKLTDSVAGKA